MQNAIQWSLLFGFLVSLGFPSNLMAAEVYRAKASGAQASCYSDHYDQDTGITTWSSFSVQFGEFQFTDPPQGGGTQLLVSFYYWFDQFDSDWNWIGGTSYFSGEVPLSEGEGILERQSSATLQTNLEVYEGWGAEDPLSVEIALDWQATGERPSRSNNNWHSQSPSFLTHGHYSSVSWPAEVSGSILLDGEELISADTFCFATLESGRDGAIYIFKH